MIATNEVDQYVQNAYDAGCPRDQLENFAAAGYVALPSLLSFHAAARECDQRRADGSGIREILLDGTRGSAKSHAVIAQVCLDDCRRVDGLKVLFLRKTQKAAGESFSDLVGRVLRYTPHVANTAKIVLPNGSRVVIGGFRNDSDIDKYLGIEFDLIVIEEISQLSEGKVLALLGSLRTSRDDWVPRLYSTTNPGGIGHTFCKERYVTPNIECRETTTRRFFCSYKDNPFINKEYRDYLESLTGDLAAAWRDGNWDIFAGQVFSMWRRNLHVIKPFEIPEHWPRWEGTDWGSAAPYCTEWVTKNPDTGRFYAYREAYQAGLSDRQQARTIKSHRAELEVIKVSWADPSMWGKKNQKDDGRITSSADEYAEEGVRLTKADNDRLSGKRKIERLLGLMPDGLPGLQVFETCHNLIRTLPALPYDETNTEDVDTDAEDHAYDALRYALSGVKTKPEKKPDPKPNPWDRVSRKGIL